MLLAAFVAWELRSPEPMLPMRFFRDRAFSAANGASLFMYFGVFGSIFLLALARPMVSSYSRCGWESRGKARDVVAAFKRHCCATAYVPIRESPSSL